MSCARVIYFNGRIEIRNRSLRRKTSTVIAVAARLLDRMAEHVDDNSAHVRVRFVRLAR